LDLDLRTFAFAVALIDILQVIAIYFQYRLNKLYHGIGWWLLGITMIAGAFASLLFRDNSSIVQILVVITNILLIPGMYFLYVGVTRFLDNEVDHRIAIPFLLVFITAIVYYTYGVDDISTRTVLQSVAVAIISFSIVYALLANKPRNIAAAINFLIAVFLVQGFYFSFHTMQAFASPVNNVFSPTLSQTILFLVVFVLSFLYTFGFIIMVSQRLSSQLREAKEHFELIFNTSPDAAFISRPEDGKVLNVNEKFTEIMGYTRDEIIGKSTLVLWKNPEDRKNVINQLREKGYCDDFQAEFLRKDGSQLTGVLSAKISLFQGVPYMISVTRDITERKRVEETLKESENKYRLLVEKATEAIIIVQDGKFKMVNPITIILTGFSEEELLSMNFVEFLYPDDRAIVMDRYQRRIMGEAISTSFAFRIVIKDGSVKWMEVNAAMIDWKGRPASLNIMTDVTERKRTEAALQEMNKKLNLLSSITRHDINNQLTALAGNLTLLEMRYPENANDENLLKAEAAAKRISSMIQFTKEYERIGVHAPIWQNVCQLVERVAKDIALDPIKVKNDIPVDLEIFTDPLIDKVFHNLFDNAIRHGGKITTIYLSIVNNNGNQQIIFEDDGNGISIDMKKELFNRGSKGAHGFGLFLSREILSITGLKIQEDGKPREGARFEIIVPAGAWRTQK
jgi:PAS domain S-box-containing protein